MEGWKAGFWPFTVQQAAIGQKQTFGNRGLLPCLSIPVRTSLNAVLTATNRKKAVTL